jgi:hypothetical protein
MNTDKNGFQIELKRKQASSPWKKTEVEIQFLGIKKQSPWHPDI